MTVEAAPRVRLDQWLWAARFFKTRSQAKTAIEGGKVHVEGTRAKPAKEISVGARLSISRSVDVTEVVVLALSDRRGPAPEAARLYAETSESAARRSASAEHRAMIRAAGLAPPERPSKRDRRALTRLKHFEGDLP